MRARGLSFGCGIVGLHPAGACGVAATAGIMEFMAGESAGQCGPCLYGLRAVADAVTRIAAGAAGATDLDDLGRWTAQLVGRGACRHPDGAAQLLASALDVFATDFAAHARHGRCEATEACAGVA
jgi:NADH:ubiquinone oxidoreductase subunit F (NADH-binding)